MVHILIVTQDIDLYLNPEEIKITLLATFSEDYDALDLSKSKIESLLQLIN